MDNGIEFKSFKGYLMYLLITIGITGSLILNSYYVNLGIMAAYSAFYAVIACLIEFNVMLVHKRGLKYYGYIAILLGIFAATYPILIGLSYIPYSAMILFAHTSVITLSIYWIVYKLVLIKKGQAETHNVIKCVAAGEVAFLSIGLMMFSIMKLANNTPDNELDKEMNIKAKNVISLIKDNINENNKDAPSNRVKDITYIHFDETLNDLHIGYVSSNDSYIKIAYDYDESFKNINDILLNIEKETILPAYSNIYVGKDTTNKGIGDKEPNIDNKYHLEEVATSSNYLNKDDIAMVDGVFKLKDNSNGDILYASYSMKFNQTLFDEFDIYTDLAHYVLTNL